MGTPGWQPSFDSAILGMREKIVRVRSLFLIGRGHLSMLYIVNIERVEM